MVVVKGFEGGRVLLLEFSEVPAFDVDHTGGDGGENNIVLGDLAADAFDVAIECALGGDVGRVGLMRRGCECGDMDDPTPTAFDHGGDEPPVEFVADADVELPDLFPVRGWCERLLDTGRAAEVV